MVLDLIMLLMLVHYSGGVDSPIYFFLIFHMIVGSLILPGIIIYSFAFAVIISFWGITTGNYFNFFEHHPITGLVNQSNVHNFNYVLSVNIVFGMVIIITVVLANNIARQLYQKEQQLYSYIQKLNKAEEEKTKYILGIVHELKTPLNALHSYLDLVLQKFLGPLDEAVEEKLIRAKRRSDEAIELINTVLKVSQMKMMDTISYEDFDPLEICNTAIARHEQSAKNKSITIRLIDECEDKKIKTSGDRFLIMIAISNLIGNAVKYSFEDGLVEIRIYNSESHIHIEVCDNGAGIPEDEQKNIFKDFFRASNIRKMVSDGAGLGLSFVKQIIDKHNGLISFQSPSRLQQPGKPGTCFKISLPITKK
jgi:signal transduction histidine kinase